MLEFYVAYKDYNWMMGFVEKMFEQTVKDVCGQTKIEYDGNKIEFKGPYKRLAFFDAIKEKTGDDISKMNEDELVKYCKSKNIETNKSMGRGKII